MSNEDIPPVPIPNPNTPPPLTFLEWLTLGKLAVILGALVIVIITVYGECS